MELHAKIVIGFQPFFCESFILDFPLSSEYTLENSLFDPIHYFDVMNHFADCIDSLDKD